MVAIVLVELTRLVVQGSSMLQSMRSTGKSTAVKPFRTSDS